MHTIIKLRPETEEEVTWPLGRALFTGAGTYQVRLEWEEFIQEEKITVLPQEEE